MAKAKAKPEWQRLIERCQKLWEAYDKAPTKKRLEAFGAHLEKMKASKSIKVKAERNSGARAFRQQWKAAGYHMAAKKKAARRRKKNPPGIPLMIPYSVHTLYERYRYGPGDPLRALLSRRAISTDWVEYPTYVSEEEFERLKTITERIIADSGDEGLASASPSEVRTAISFRETLEAAEAEPALARNVARWRSANPKPRKNAKKR